MGDAPQHSRCKDCDRPAVRRFSAPAVTFKGSGFYRTDRNR